MKIQSAHLLGLVFAGLLLPLSASAQKAALTQDRDQAARNAYWENAQCTVLPCEIAFTAVPNGKRLVVTFVSIFGSASNLGQASYIDLRAQTNAPHVTPRAFLNATPLPSGTTYQGAQGLFAVFDAGEIPSIYVLGSSAGPSASISGYMINYP